MSTAVETRRGDRRTLKATTWNLENMGWTYPDVPEQKQGAQRAEARNKLNTIAATIGYEDLVIFQEVKIDSDAFIELATDLTENRGFTGYYPNGRSQPAIIDHQGHNVVMFWKHGRGGLIAAEQSDYGDHVGDSYGIDKTNGFRNVAECANDPLSHRIIGKLFRFAPGVYPKVLVIGAHLKKFETVGPPPDNTVSINREDQRLHAQQIRCIEGIITKFGHDNVVIIGADMNDANHMNDHFTLQGVINGVDAIYYGPQATVQPRQALIHPTRRGGTITRARITSVSDHYPLGTKLSIETTEIIAESTKPRKKSVIQQEDSALIQQLQSGELTSLGNMRIKPAKKAIIEYDDLISYDSNDYYYGNKHDDIGLDASYDYIPPSSLSSSPSYYNNLHTHHDQVLYVALAVIAIFLLCTLYLLICIVCWIFGFCTQSIYGNMLQIKCEYENNENTNQVQHEIDIPL